MTIMRVESLTYGVEDMAIGTRYYDDWGLPKVDHGTHGADYLLPSGQTVKLRNAADPSLSPPTETGSTVRDIVWGVDSAASLDALGSELSRDQKVAHDSEGGLHAKDPWGMPLTFAVAFVLSETVEAWSIAASRSVPRAAARMLAARNASAPDSAQSTLRSGRV